jgi:5-methylcytosine-specific restriction endonuclease McrA
MTEIPARLRELILGRDEFCCLGCGRDIRHIRWYSLQHRQARGTGGGNNPANLVTLCGSATSQGCHLLCEARDDEMRARGFWVPSWQDPAAVPLVLWTGRAVYLTDDGGYRDSQ